ncbi:MAG: c-type cytochrome biogenesis protein CcmI [Burkholderiales bacterium]
MIGFAASAAGLVGLALFFVLRPLLRRQPGRVAEPERDASNLQIIRDQLVELELDLQSGAISAGQYAYARNDLERRVLEETESTETVAVQESRSGKPVVAGIALALPVVATLLYLQLGDPQGLDVERHVAQDASSITLDQFEEMTQRLAARLNEDPDDAEGWSMLGRAYKALERYDESRQAWARAAELEPGNAAILTDYAEALALSRGGTLEGEPTALLERALGLDPEHGKALALAGGAAFEREDYASAIRLWQRLVAQSRDDPELTAALESGIAEAQARRDGKPGPAAVSGTVTLGQSVTSKTAPDDTVFVFARAAEGPRMPLATIRLQVKDLPYNFSLDDSMAMTPEMKLSKFDAVVIGARVSRSGDAQRASGDIEGYSGAVEPGAQSVNVVIDRVVP